MTELTILSSITLGANLIALVIGLWLGIYLVTRSPRSPISWLTGFTLWSLSGHFLNVLLALAAPPLLEDVPGWLNPLFRFWEANVQAGANRWLQGWLIIPAVVFWHHATTLMHSQKLNPWQWTRLVLGYAGTAIAIVLQVRTPWLLVAAPVGDPLYLNALEAGPFYSLFVALGLLYTGVSVTNLLNLARAARTEMFFRQFVLLITSTLIAALAVPFSIAGSLLGKQVPIVVTSLPIALGMALLGYGVARYSALVEGRTIRRDFFQAAATAFAAAGLYLTATWLLVRLLDAPPAFYVLIVLPVIVTHSLVDFARYQLDSTLYRRREGQIRAGLQDLAQLVREQERLDEHLWSMLELLCVSVRAIFGLVFLFEDDGPRLAATYDCQGGEPNLSLHDLTADDVLYLKPGHFAPPLAEAALLIPLYGDGNQLGALILGRPVNSVRYAPSDTNQLLYASDRLGDLLWDLRRHAEQTKKVAREVDTPGTPIAPPIVRHSTPISVKVVEDALRHMADYAYLGDHTLAQLAAVRSRVKVEPITHLDLGKAVHGTVAEAVDKLRPPSAPPREPPSRDWYPYLILHEAYLEGIPNRDIMSRLYISEGTFNRTRRAALRSVTRVLQTMETSLN